jgi:hypothetical protein
MPGGPDGRQDREAGFLGQDEQTFLGPVAGTLRSIQDGGAHPGPGLNPFYHLKQGPFPSPGRGPSDRLSPAFLGKPGQVFAVTALTEHEQGMKRAVKIRKKYGGPVPAGPDKGPGTQKKFSVEIRFKDFNATAAEPGFQDEMSGGNQALQTDFSQPGRIHGDLLFSFRKGDLIKLHPFLF